MGTGIRTHLEFKKFYEDFFPGVYFLLKKYTKEERYSWDLAQESFLKVYEKRMEFEDVESAKAFVYIIARNLFINCYRREKLRKEVYSDFKYNALTEVEDFLEDVTTEETLRLLYAAINRLPAQTRSIILLNLKGKNNAEVAEELHISVNTVKTLKKNAYRTLKQWLGKDYWLLLFLFLD